MDAIALLMVARLAVGGLVVYPQLQEQRTEQACLAQVEQHYQAGLAFQNVNDWEAAEAEFKQVITLNADYKDVQTRLLEWSMCQNDDLYTDRASRPPAL